jgi:hypothetical protein
MNQAGEEMSMRRAESAAMSGDDVTLGELRRTLGRIELRQESVVQDHEARLRRVERWVYAVPPAIIVSAAAIIVAIVRGGP